jgi:short-subunit dehydrogenase
MATQPAGDASAFKAKYGPWAVIAGASEGTGQSFARQIAAKGVSCILIANGGPLEETAASIRRETGVEVITALIDLSKADAGERIIEVAGDREIGLYVNNAGAGRFGADRFLERDVEDWLGLSRINIDTLIRCAHHFARQMRTRGRGGILIVNSGACYSGSRFLALYSAAKGFQLNFAESLWSELRPFGVDVLTIVLGKTDTPGFRRRREEIGLVVSDTNLASPDAVAAQGLDRLAFGPVTNWGVADEDGSFYPVSAAERRQAVLRMEQYATEAALPPIKLEAD